MLVKARRFLTQQEKNPLPMRTMRINHMERETEKAILVSLIGTPLPQSNCVLCGREITHPVSLHFGIGSTCIKKYPHLLAQIDETDIEASYENLKKEMEKITWKGWLPKSQIELIPENKTRIIFEYNNKQYRIVTDNEEKIQQIEKMSDKIILKEVI